jgi:hypothetical protein
MKLSLTKKLIAISTGLVVAVIGLAPLEATATQSATTSVDQQVTSTDIAMRRRGKKRRRGAKMRRGSAMSTGGMRKPGNMKPKPGGSMSSPPPGSPSPGPTP